MALPFADDRFGYDISDYTDIDPVFGSLEGSMRWSRPRTRRA
jgi:glycosidase